MKLLRVVVGATAGILLASPFALADGSAKQAALSAAGKSPGMANGPVVLTVSGEKGWYRTTYENGEMRVPPLVYDLGEDLPDGHYSYEYRSAPPASAAAGVSAKSANQGNQLGRIERPPTGQLVWGSFEVANGAVVAN